MVLESFSPEQTKQIAVQLAQASHKGDLFCLCGDLGVGKTIFSKGFAEGLGVFEDVTSPTFSIVNIYEGRLPLYHFDVYRINDILEMEDTGYEDYFFGEGVCLVEWADMIKELMPKQAIWVSIEKDYDKGDDYRKITVKRVFR